MIRIAIVIVVVCCIGIGLFGLYRIWDGKDAKKEVWKIGIALILPLCTFIYTIVSPKSSITVLSPEIEKKIRENDRQKEELKEKDRIIVNVTKEKDKLKNKVSEFKKKNYADIQNADLIVEGLKKDSQSSIALVNNTIFLNKDILKEILNQDVSYDEESSTLYVGGKGTIITKEALQDDYSILYNGKNYINLGSDKANSIKEPKVAGKELTQGFIIESNKSEGSYVLLRIDDRFSSIEFDVGMLDSTSEYNIGDAVMRIELDGKEKYKEKVPSQIASSHYQFDISGAKTLKIQLSDSYSQFGFYNVIFNKK